MRKQTVAGLHVGLATAAIVCLALWLVQDDVNRLFTDSTEVMAIVDLLGFVCDMGIAGIWLAYPVGFVFSDLLVGRRALRLMQ